MDAAGTARRAVDLLGAAVKLRAVVRLYRERGAPSDEETRQIDLLVSDIDRVLDRKPEKKAHRKPI